MHAIETVGLTKYYGDRSGLAKSFRNRLRPSSSEPVRALESLDIAVREGEIFVTDLESGSEQKVTAGAGGTITNGTAEFVAQVTVRPQVVQTI